MYEATTRNLRVRVEPAFVEERSSPEDNLYFWSYTVEIENLGTDTVQLRSRYWHMTDSSGHTREVRGPGVVGKEPVIAPGDSFSYTSGAPLVAPSGIMHGWYEMEGPDGSMFRITIPAFSLDSPHANISAH